ncbi:MAG: RHS repeat-associated core domain-containing protein, partial [Bacteroidales bacterium]|nr:RHS repeat-associated core domain-containing protein [Bacteroidales bacterium]
MVQHLTYYFSSYSQVFADNYSFSAKERDSETGLSYFGSRYYSSDLSIWLSVDPMSDKYASLSPYN